MSTLRVYRRHLYGEDAARARDRYCATGCRAFFARHGLNWGEFLRNGIDAQVFIDIGDSMALKAVQHAREEADGGR